MTSVVVRGVEFSYSSGRLHEEAFRLDCPEFNAEPKDLTCLVGSNGSGKTTLLRLITGELPCAVGTIDFVQGTTTIRDAAARRRLVARIDSALAEALVDDLQVIDHLALALYVSGRHVPLLPRRMTLSNIEREVQDLLPLGIDLTDLIHERVGHLSAGQRQGLAISCATLQRAKVVLADESTAHLDASNARLFFLAIKAEAQRHSVPVIVVTHDLMLAAEFGDVVYGVQAGAVRRLALPPLRDFTERLGVVRHFIGAGG